MSSKITLRFDAVPAVDEYISLKVGYQNNLRETFVTVRSGFGQSKIETGDVVVTRQNFYGAFQLDYNEPTQIFTVTLVSTNIIEIEHPINGFFDFGTVDNQTNGNVVVVSIGDSAQEEIIDLELVDYDLDISDVCNVALANVTASGGNSLYNVYKLPSLSIVGSNETSPFTISTSRNNPQSVRITDTAGLFIGELQLNAPRKILEDDITFDILNLSTGVTLTINTVFISDDIQPYTYSVGGAFQESNVFSGLTPDTYTVTVMDAFGCSQTKQVVLDGITEVSEIVFDISEVNALRFAKIESGKKNHKNTLSCNELKKTAYPYFHKYLSTDIITTQFKTNAPYINIYSIDISGNTTAISEFIKTSNVGLEARSTCTYFNLGDGRSAVYFGVVDILDPDSSAFIETTDFGFILPVWANSVGKLVNISGVGEVAIASIGYSDFYQAFIAEFDVAYTGLPEERELYSGYNLQPYEVYEFNTIMADLPDLFNVVIEVGLDAENITHSYISEKVKLVEDSDALFEVIYYDDVNVGGMVYQTGIQHKMLLEGYFDNEGEQETEGYNGDTDFFVTDNVVYDTQTFEAYRLSSEMASKLRLAVAHEHLIINGLSYKIAQAPEIKKNKFNNSRVFSVLLKRGGDSILPTDIEVLNGDGDAIAGAIEASKGKALVLWTKTSA